MRTFLIAFGALVLLTGGAQAAEFFLAESGNGTVAALEGRIGPGDAAKFERFMMDAGPRIATLRLRSPGGRAGEAMKIGALVRQYLLVTEAPPAEGAMASCPEHGADCVCASACVFVWVAGIHRNPDARLEVHRPGRADGTDPESREESESALRRYLEALETPEPLAALVLATPPNRLEPVPAPLVREAGGYVPSVEAILARRCPEPRRPACERRILAELRRAAHEAARETDRRTPQ